MHLIKLTVVVLALAAVPACSKGGAASCADVVDHVKKISGLDLPDAARQGAIDRCEKEPAAKRACALAAATMEQLMACK